MLERPRARAQRGTTPDDGDLLEVSFCARFLFRALAPWVDCGGMGRASRKLMKARVSDFSDLPDCDFDTAMDELVGVGLMRIETDPKGKLVFGLRNFAAYHPRAAGEDRVFGATTDMRRFTASEHIEMPISLMAEEERPRAHNSPSQGRASRAGAAYRHQTSMKLPIAGGGGAASETGSTGSPCNRSEADSRAKEEVLPLPVQRESETHGGGVEAIPARARAEVTTTTPPPKAGGGFGFGDFLGEYPRLVDLGWAQLEWGRAIAVGVDPAAIISGLRRYPFDVSIPSKIKPPGRWLQDRCWLEQPNVINPNFQGTTARKMTVTEIMRAEAERAQHVA